MSEITLEKIDLVRERTGASYAEAKEALEACNGNVVDALIHIENNSKSFKNEMYTTKEDFLAWLKELIRKGNVNRIKIKKDDKVIADVPVTAGVAATVIVAMISVPLLAIGILTAAFTRVTVEITKDDGSVEVVNKVINNSVGQVKDKMMDVADNIKDKFRSKDKVDFDESAVYKYTVKFDEVDDDKDKK